MLDLASHIVKIKEGHFDPDKFDDRYEDALKELLKMKQEGKPIERPEPTNVVNLMDALRRSVEVSGGAPASSKGKGSPAGRRIRYEGGHRIPAAMGGFGGPFTFDKTRSASTRRRDN